MNAFLKQLSETYPNDYILYSFKIKNSHLPLKVDMERFDFVIF